MPQYKLLAPSYVPPRPGETAALLPAGATIEYDGHPGTNMAPMDDAGHARQAAYFKSKGITLAVADHRKKILTEGAADSEGALVKLAGQQPVSPTGGTPQPATDHVAIPADWATLDAGKLTALAAKLGAPAEVTTRAEAMAFIKAEVDRRMGRTGGPPAAA